MNTDANKAELRDFREAAGIVATNWSHMEDLIEATVWRLVSLRPKYGRALTTHIGFVTQCNIVRLLLEDKFPDKFDAKEWATLITRITTLRNARNTIVHARWESSLEASPQPALLAFEYKAKASLEGTVVICSLPYMRGIGYEISKLTSDYRSYLGKNFSLSASLYRPWKQQPHTPRPQGKKQPAPRRRPPTSGV